MFEAILLALWFFAPAGVANVTPILVARLPWVRRFDYPMDFHAALRGKRVFGAHKTWRGLIGGTLAAIATVALQVLLVQHGGAWLQALTAPVGYDSLNVWLLGLLFGLGALGGDAIESFFKRQINVKPGHSWFPFDQIDYIIGGIISTLAVVRLPLAVYVWVVIIWLLIHLFSSYLGWRMRLKDRPL